MFVAQDEVGVANYGGSEAHDRDSLGGDDLKQIGIEQSAYRYLDPKLFGALAARRRLKRIIFGIDSPTR